MIVARVNNYEITIDEFNAELKKVLHEMKIEQPNNEAKKLSLEQLIDGYLLLSSAKDSDVDISEQEIENDMIELKMKFNSEDEFNAMLQNNQMDINVIRDRLSNNLLIKKFVNNKFPMDCEVTEDKLLKVYQENTESFMTNNSIRASHILIKSDEENAEERIKQIYDEVNTPEDFYIAATTCSECPSNCKSGDLGYFEQGKMVKAFDDVAFNLEVGEISKPVKTQFGYHIIMVTDIKRSDVADFSEVKEALKMRLQRIDSELKLINHIKDLRKTANITINHDNY